MQEYAVVVGGGLAGAEAAWQLARRGISVILYEMRPKVMTGAHRTGNLAELVCSNSLGSQDLSTASGLLQEELAILGSLLLTVARNCSVPAGTALAVDREMFAITVTEYLQREPLIEIRREEVLQIPTDPFVIIASGPLTSPSLSRSLEEVAGMGQLFFYDAIAPLVEADSIREEVCFRGSRYQKGELPGGDYWNCPLSREEYFRFIEALRTAECFPLPKWEKEQLRFFEGCLPIEELARRDPLAPAFGPMRPAGLRDPRTGKKPFAVVQLRQDNVACSLLNMVGFQTNLKWSEQARVFRLIPGLETARFARFGQMHRNTFLCSPKLLEPTLEFRGRPGLFFAGQITGVEGYVGNAGTGLVAAINLARRIWGIPPRVFPRETMLGSLLWYVTHAGPETFQPMKANFGLLPPLETNLRDRELRHRALVERALQTMREFAAEMALEEQAVARLSKKGALIGS